MLYIVKKNKRTGIYFVFDYTPKANLFFGKDFNPEVYNFKFFGHSREEFKAIVECAVEIFECETSVAIPGSGIEENNVQRICKKEIMLIPQDKKPDRHSHPGYQLILEEEKKRLKIKKREDFERVLLVDDIVTTGTTMRIYKNILTSIGIKEVEMFAFAHKAGEAEIKHAICIKDSFNLELDENFDLLDINMEEEETEEEVNEKAKVSGRKRWGEEKKN